MKMLEKSCLVLLVMKMSNRFCCPKLTIPNLQPIITLLTVGLIMWTLVFKPEHNEYDAVPNVWLVDVNRCMYPDKGTQTVKKMAKEEAAVENEGWDEVEINIIKRDYENFERCMTDVIRYQKGKRSVTESEQETRGKSLREKKKRKMSSEESSSNDDTSSEEGGRGSQYLFPKKKAQKLVSPQPTKQVGLTADKQSSPKQKNPNSLTSSSKERVRSPEKRKELKKCKLSNSRHFCVQKGGNVSRLDQIADGLCSISRSFVSLRAYVTEQFETLKSQLSTMQTNNTEFTTDEQPIPDQEIQELASTWFPVDSEAKFEEMENLLKNSQFREKIVNTLTILGATSSSSSRALSSMLKECLSPTLTSTFSWSGQKKLDSKKKAFNETAFQKVLFSAAKKRFQYEEKKIEKTVKTWLQQTAYELQHSEKARNRQPLAVVRLDNASDG